jgi:hypothetical protein
MYVLIFLRRSFWNALENSCTVSQLASIITTSGQKTERFMVKILLVLSAELIAMLKKYESVNVFGR